ncbi:PA14 domain-containing protein [Marinobacterium sedimentorum]|uniref:PA14 domain-containing protein n=1 Tax=Marinobacterium sedimentorum TaxID=2927804 RepID=UPI0020C6606D|nr:PA14 domain-containing protein [Marinobacterium sedimentorum]MCP8687774.1 PA14 domain-containing protein [Marinobacterium sedimentorum]
MRKLIPTWPLACLLSSAALLFSTAGQAQTPVAADNLQPGLQVCYIDGMIRHIDEMVRLESSKPCEPGPDLRLLNSSVGDATVLTSNLNDGVMARITGLIHLETVGTYLFTFESNDGVRLEIDGQMILEDPDVHSDRYAEYGSMDVTEPGWYPLTVRYFERKNTSTLRFFWQPPGTEGTMPKVPAAALAHKGA